MTKDTSDISKIEWASTELSSSGGTFTGDLSYPSTWYWYPVPPDKSKAFEIARRLVESSIVKTSSVKQFIALVDEIAKVL